MTGVSEALVAPDALTALISRLNDAANAATVVGHDGRAALLHEAITALSATDNRAPVSIPADEGEDFVCPCTVCTEAREYIASRPTKAMVDAARSAITKRYYEGGAAVQQTPILPREMAELVLNAAFDACDRVQAKAGVGRFENWSAGDLAAQCLSQAREQLDPEFSQFLAAVARRLAAQPATGTGEGLREALDLIRSAHEHINSITVQRRKLGPIATQAQTAGHALATAERILAALSADNRAPVEDGWRLVPVEPTEAMCEAASCQAQKPTGWHSVYPSMWRAFLAAAPTPPTGSRETEA